MVSYLCRRCRASLNRNTDQLSKTSPSSSNTSKDEDETDEDFAEESEEDNTNAGEDGEAKSENKLSRSEKKTMKAMLRLGMQVIPNVSCVTVKKSNNVVHVFSNPTVFKHPTKETCVIIGKFSIMEISPETQNVEQSNAPSTSYTMVKEYEDIDETELDSKDIELLMQETGLCWTDAVEALKAADNNVITAILDHQMKFMSF